MNKVQVELHQVQEVRLYGVDTTGYITLSMDEAAVLYKGLRSIFASDEMEKLDVGK